MASQRKDTSKPKRRAPATTPEGRERQIIALAVDEAERQIRAGEASSQVLTHYLKLGSTREKIEQEKLVMEVNLLTKKAESMDSARRMEELYDEAIKAMRSYGGNQHETD